MCFWRKVFLFSLYYSLANIFSTQAGSNLLLYKLIRWKNFFGRSFQNGGACVDVRKKLKIVDLLEGNFSPMRFLFRTVSQYEVEWPLQPQGRSFIRPVYLGLNPRHTWKGCGSSFLWWLTPSCFCAGLVSAGQSVRRLLCALFNNRKDSVVGKKINFSRSSLSRPNAC